MEEKKEEEDPGEEILNYVVDDAFVKSDDAERIFGPTDNLIIGMILGLHYKTLFLINSAEKLRKNNSTCQHGGLLI